MKLMGREVTADKVLTRINERLRARGLPVETLPVPPKRSAPKVEQLTFNLQMLETHADPAQPLPFQGPHTPAAQWRQLPEKLLRALFQPVLDGVFARQRRFNGHVRDSYAQLSAEVLKLQRQVAELQKSGHAAPAAPRKVARKAAE